MAVAATNRVPSRRLGHPQIILGLILPLFLILAGLPPDAGARTVQFPDDSVGRLYVRTAGSGGLLASESMWGRQVVGDALEAAGADDWVVLANAAGAVEVPDGKDLRLDVSNEAVADLAWLAALPADAIQTLSFADTEVGEDSLKQLAGWTDLQELVLSGTDTGDEGLAHVARLKTLKALDLTETFISDAGLKHLAGLTELRTLILDGCKISGVGLDRFVALTNLEHLGLAKTEVNDETIANLEGLTQLRRLDISGTPITNEHVVSLSGLSNLEHLGIGGENQKGLYFEPLLTDAAIEPLLELGNLRSLSLAAGVTDEGLAEIAGIETLERLVLIGVKYTDKGLRHLSGNSSIKELFFMAPPDSRVTVPITGEGLAHLKKIEGLKGLGLENTDVENKDLVHLSEMTSLEVLNLDSPGISDEGLRHISGLTSLTSVHLPFTVTDAGLAHLSGLTNLRRLNLPFSKVTDAGLASLKGMTDMAELDLYGTQLTAKAVVSLKAMKNLRLLLIGFTNIGEAEVDELRRELPLCDVRDF